MADARHIRVAGHDPASASWRRDISANEMSCAASEVPMMKPVSCCREKSFRDDHEQIAESATVQMKTASVTQR